jgi:hypothetical protein
LYLGCQEILATLFSVVKLPIASTTMTRFFRKIKQMKEVEAMSEGLWGYLSKLIPWEKIIERRFCTGRILDEELLLHGSSHAPACICI